MKIPALLAIAALCLVSAPSLQLMAQPAPAQAPAEGTALLEVNAVRFSSQRFNGDNWLEAEVDVHVRPGGRAVSGQFVDRARVSLTISVEVPDERAGNRTVFYRSSAEAVTLEGGRASFRFYLPPEVVRRDRLRTDVRFFVVELEAGGQPQPLTRSSASTGFTSADSIRNFLSRANSEGAANDGVMLPQHLTPFATEARLRAPSMIRREAQR
jgi:hypothetical protein